jgi:hypothetical protein
MHSKMPLSTPAFVSGSTRKAISPSVRHPPGQALARRPDSCFTPPSGSGERIMAKGQMRSNKEARKPKKEAPKKSPAAALKAAPVAATKQKDKK